MKHSKTCIRLAMAALVGLSTLCASGQDREPAKTSIPKPAKRLVGDYSYSSRTQTPPYTSKQIPYAQLTHIIHFGVGVYSDGTLYVDPDFLEPNLLYRAHKNGVKVLLAVCGGPSSEAVVPALVANLAVFVKKHGYDGVDIDWEAPTVAQTSMFYNLMASLRAALPSPTYLISTDLGWAGTNGYAIPQVNQFLDFFNIETYDCAGPWTADGQLNSQIIWDPNDTDPWECQPAGAANEDIALFLQEGVPPSQLNIGTPFYGYYYATVSALWGPCSNASETKDGNCDWSVYYENYGTFFKQRINQKGWKTLYDPIAQVPYMLRVDGKPGFGTYDDEYSTYYRVSYSEWNQNLGGTFIWSLDADYDGQTQDLLDAAYAASFPPTN
jgi:chitinase